jgi:cryptochrome
MRAHQTRSRTQPLVFCNLRHHLKTMTTRSCDVLVQGLRLHDNHALDQARKDAEALYPVFCLDPWFIEVNSIGSNRINFLLECLADLDASLKQIGSRLIVLHGKPTEVLPAVAKHWGVTNLYFEKDTEPYALKRDGEIATTMRKQDVDVRSQLRSCCKLSSSQRTKCACWRQ